MDTVEGLEVDTTRIGQNPQSISAMSDITEANKQEGIEEVGGTGEGLGLMPPGLTESLRGACGWQTAAIEELLNKTPSGKTDPLCAFRKVSRGAPPKGL